MPSTFHAALAEGEAVLRFPYDDDLRRLLRAIPGRRWDPVERAWCVPLEPESAEALGRLLAGLPEEPQVSEGLTRAIERRRRKRRRGECTVDRVRPDEEWWLGFPTDTAPELAEALLEHPEGYSVPAIGRGLIPLDELAARIVGELGAHSEGLRLSEGARGALRGLLDEIRREENREQRRNRGDAGGDERADQGGRGEPRAANGLNALYEVELCRDRRNRVWVLLAPEHAPLARTLAERAGLRAGDGPGGTFALAAVDYDAPRIAELLELLEPGSVDPRVGTWLERATEWRGSIEVEGPGEAPVFMLLGNMERLPRELRERAASVPGGASVPLTLESWRLMEGRLRGWISPAAKRCVAALREGRPAPPAVLELSGIHEDPTFVLAPGHDTQQLEAFAALAGTLPHKPRRGAAHEHAQLPAIRADPFCVPELDRFLAEHGTWVEAEALALLQEVREEHARAAGLVALSAARNAELEVAGLGGELKPFQRAGVSYLLSQRRAFLADEQGLGKTIEALAALESDGAYPAVVVCPASLKLNWLREIERWLPGRTARMLTGTGGRASARTGAGGGARVGTKTGAGALALAANAATRSVDASTSAAEITVVNYDIVAARLDELRALGPRALVVDESHFCKNAAAKRTQAVVRLAAAVPQEGLVMALTGTPVMNRPPELIAQLRILGRLGDFGSGAQFGRRFRGPDAHLRLHWHLRARCFVRRLKAEVLPQLPAKTRGVVPVELDNEAEYRLAERDVVAWLRSQPLDLRELDAKVAAALRAERLVRLNALKLLAARGKLHAALAWIHDFCSSGERLVVFARHREIQRALLERFPTALHILGEDGHAARDASLRAFQEPDAADNQLIVCSIEVAGQGITLTQASNVAFLELDWTPAKHDQAEDRCHRIGQQDAVNAWYLLAADTIDETIATLLERKRAVIGAVTDGREEDEEGVLDALVRDLRGEPYRHLRAVA
ncbi:MAG TPA: DEAD/DEAH box helicase [Solirubrobacteraceae bacterium]|jgi:SWI/SNF-related matrix-associated actin-dependent regulator 1 of chromatin subfamily A|nr:DEAD/DEAH box helicase [Solirubrobacteraceae bacterium]